MKELLEKKVKEYTELYNEWTLNDESKTTIEELDNLLNTIANLTIRKYGYTFSKDKGEEYTYKKNQP